MGSKIVLLKHYEVTLAKVTSGSYVAGAWVVWQQCPATDVLGKVTRVQAPKVCLLTCKAGREHLPVYHAGYCKDDIKAVSLKLSIWHEGPLQDVALTPPCHLFETQPWMKLRRHSFSFSSEH